MERYKSLALRPLGGRRKVHRCEDLQTRESVTVKWIPFENKSGGLPYEVLREISVLKELNHVNIVRLLDVVDEKDRFGLVLEDMWNDLAGFIEEHPHITMFPCERKSFLFQILQAVAYCHSQKVLHRDLRPKNLVVDIFGETVKLADFSCARTFDVPLPQYSMGIATYGYSAPELLISSEYSSAVDIWAVGCIFAEMVTSKPLFDGRTEMEVMIQIFRMFGLPGDADWPEYFKMFDLKEEIPSEPTGNLADMFPQLETEGLDLLSKLLCVDQKKRITALDALQHPYFRDVQVAHLAKV